jgi:hypothetical protein
MASLPTIKRVQRTDLGANVPEWVDSLLSPINQFMEEIYSAFNRNLTIPENVAGQVFNINFKTLGNYQNNKEFTEIRVLSKIKSRAKVLIVGQCEKAGDPSKKHDAIFITWYDNNDGTISIRYISGLENNSEYNITIIGF